MHAGRGTAKPLMRSWAVVALVVVAGLASSTGPASAAPRSAPTTRSAGAAVVLPTASYGVACGASSCQFANPLSEVYPAPLTWSTTPSLFGVPTGGNVGWATPVPQRGIVTVGAITDGVADQGVEDWLQAVYDAPNPTGTSSAWDSLTVHAHIYTEVLSNNFGVFSNVSASFLNFVLQSEGVQDEQDVSVNTGVTVGPPDTESMETLEQFLDFASSQMQNAATSAISAVEGQASPQSAFSNFLTSTLGGAVYQTDLTVQVNVYVNGENSQPVDIQLSPDLVVANAGLGITGTYAVSLVQLTVSGTAQPAGTPTSLALSLYGPGGQPLPVDSHGFPTAGFGQPLELKASLRTSSGGTVGLSGPKVAFQVPAAGAREPLTCTLEDGACTATVLATSPMPTGFQVVAARWPGGDGYAGSGTSALVDVGPGPSRVQLVPRWPVGADVMAGQSYGVRVLLSSASGVNFLQLGTGGTVSLLDNGTVVGTCVPAELPETSGDGCDITWVPFLAAGTATRPARLEATWTGNRTYVGSAGEMAASVTVAHPGVGLFLTAEPPELGYSWSEACSTNKFGGTTCKPKLSLKTSGTLTAQVLLDGNPIPGATVQFSTDGPGSLSAPACTTGQDGSCQVAVEVPVPKTTTSVEVGAKTDDVPGHAGTWRQSLAVLDVGLYGSAAPSVAGVTPASGPATGGNTVKVTGQDLWGASKVSFGGVPAPGFWVQSDGSVMVVAPRGEGTCNVQVTTPLGTSAANTADRYSFGGTSVPANGAVVLPGDLNGMAPAPGGGAWASLSPRGTGGAPSPAGSIVLVAKSGGVARRYPAPNTTGWMALYDDVLYYLARTGTSYTNWQTTLVRLSPATGSTRRFSYTATPTGPGGVAVGAHGEPVYLGVSEIGGPYGVPVVLELSPATGRFTSRAVPSPQGGYVGGLAPAPGGGVWGIVPKSSEIFLLSSPRGPVRTFIAPGTTTPVSLDAIMAVGTTAYAAVAGAAPGTVGIYAVNSASGARQWLPAPRDIASVSGLAWDDGLWVGAVTGNGVAGALGYRDGRWQFVPAYSHASFSARFALAAAGPGELWLGQTGSDRLWQVPTGARPKTRP